MANKAHSAIYEIGAFNTRVVRELAALPDPVRHLGAVDPAASESGEDVRIYAAPVEAARLMRTIVALQRFDVAFNEEDGNWVVDVRAGDGVAGAILDLVASAIDADQLSFATVCIGKRSLLFYPRAIRLCSPPEPPVLGPQPARTSDTGAVVAQGRGSAELKAVRGRFWRSPLWRKAPIALTYHRSALLAVAIAGFLVVLAASSAPFVTTASASSALKENLSGLSPLATGLEIQGIMPSASSAAAEAGIMARRQAAIRTLTDRLHLEPPVFTEQSDAPVAVSTSNGDQPVTLMARTGALGHVKILSQTSGDGVWVSDLTAKPGGIRPGGKLRIVFSERGTGETRSATVRVKGIYRALDSYRPGPLLGKPATRDHHRRRRPAAAAALRPDEPDGSVHTQLQAVALPHDQGQRPRLLDR